VACYNFDIHEPIVIIFGIVTEKVSNERMLYFSPHLTIGSALLGETGNREIAPFDLNAAACSFANKYKKTHEISPGQCLQL